MKWLVVGGMAAAERGEQQSDGEKLHNRGPWKYNYEEEIEGN